jgi:hypothetical protein
MSTAINPPGLHVAGLRSFPLRHSASVELRSVCNKFTTRQLLSNPRFFSGRFVCDIERGAADATVEGEGEGAETEMMVKS